ncbi:hypothetical protein HDU78_006138 [Chytriomyces hyalinus]|nr:hypothetical protein HDU78_006138 [Chytriomyces hyalinus]KAJ3264930.1 hypothetical protein HDU77_007210 [Chytriomyces hyalinus]
MHPNSKADEEQWPAKYGHPPKYFEDLLITAEQDAFSFGYQLGLYAAGFLGLLTFAASKLPQHSLHAHGFSKQVLGNSYSGIRAYHIGLASIMGGLITSQVGTHYTYQRAHDRITEQRRREAFWRAEARKRGEL